MKFLSMLAFLMACDMALASEPSPYQEFPAKQSSRDVKIPKLLVQEIEKEYKEFQKLMKVPEDTPITRELLNVYVDFTQKRAAALHEDLRVLAPTGGGVIDMQEFVTPLRGAFRARVVFERTKDKMPEHMKVFYVSRAQKRNLDGDKFGAGCGRFFDITNYFKTKLSQDGVEVFTADQRYVSVLAGTIVLVSFDKDALLVGSVTFEDGRYPALQCEG